MATSDGEKQKNRIKNLLTSDEVVGVAKIITQDDLVRVLDYSLEDASKDKLGFTGTHHILKIKAQKSNTNDHETISAFVKIANLPMTIGMEDNFDTTMDVNSFITDRESFFLNTLVSQFLNDCKSEKWCPTHYYTTKNVVIMEDLKSNGYKIIEDFIDNEEILKSVLSSLARFHSCSIIAEARKGQKSKPIPLNEQYEGKFPEMMFLKSAWFDSTIKLTGALAEHFGYDPDKVRELFDQVPHLIKPSAIHQNTICHGDVHSKNLMFADASPLPHCVLIDFQTYRYGPLVLDILQFLHTNSSRKFREENEAKLVEFYHSVLTETIKSNDSTNNDVRIPSLEEIFKGMEDLRLFGLVISCIYFPILFIDPEIMKEHARDAEFNKNLISGDRTALTFSQLKVNELFRNKVEEAIRELFERS